MHNARVPALRGTSMRRQKVKPHDPQPHPDPPDSRRFAPNLIGSFGTVIGDPLPPERMIECGGIRSVRAKLPEAMVNEVLLKCLAHNLYRLVHAIHELGVEPQLLGEPVMS